MKVCKCCGVEKHEDEFNNRLTCKVCVSKKLREKRELAKLFGTPSVRTEHKHFAWLDLCADSRPNYSDNKRHVRDTSGQRSFVI